jgi:uncharacterized protein
MLNRGNFISGLTKDPRILLMIEVNHALLSDEALDNLIFEVITRQGTDYGEFEIDIQTKKEQLTRQLKSGLAVIVYSSDENVCDIIKKEDFQKLQAQTQTS